MLLACYSHKHISYRIRTIIRKAIDLGVASLAVLEIPQDKPEKWDAADCVKDGISIEEFLALTPLLIPIPIMRETDRQ